MSAIRVSQPGQPTRLVVIDSGCTPHRSGPYYLQGGSAVVGVPPKAKTQRTPEQRAADTARSRQYHAADPQRALERQRRYRKRMKGAA